MNLVGLEPGAGEPSVLPPDTAAHFAVVNEVAAPAVGDPNAGELVFVVVSEVAVSVAEEIAVAVVA